MAKKYKRKKNGPETRAKRIAKRNLARVREIERSRLKAEAADLLLDGLSVREISSRITVAVPTVNRWIMEHRRELKENALTSHKDKQNHAIAVMVKIYREAKAGWERSKQPEVEETIEAVSEATDIKGPDGQISREPVVVRRIARKRTRNRDGDPQLLRVAMDARKEIHRLQQLTDKPTRVSVKQNNLNINAAPPGHDDLVARLDALNLSDEELAALSSAANKFAKLGHSPGQSLDDRTIDAARAAPEPASATGAEDAGGPPES